MRSIILLMIILYVSSLHAEIIPSKYMSQDIYSDDNSFLVRIKPNKELNIPYVLALYKKQNLSKKMASRFSLKNGIDLKIPKEIDGFKISDLYFKVDLDAGYGGAIKGITGFVSMWAGHLPVKFILKDGSHNQVINYQSQIIGFHGASPTLHCSKATKQVAKIVLNGITTLKFVPKVMCE